MPGPPPPTIVLAEQERDQLERLVRARATGQQLAARARAILLAADGLSTAEVARRLHLDEDTVRLWRARWSAGATNPPANPSVANPSVANPSVAERLADAPKSGRPARITPEQLCQIIALACELPADSDRPISQWSARELADEIIRRGIVDRISPRHAGRILKSGRPQAPSDSLLAHPTGR
jgi:putative transposase